MGGSQWAACPQTAFADALYRMGLLRAIRNCRSARLGVQFKDLV